MSITASQVKELRERTGAGMMECKKALVETAGDLDAAVELMRVSGLAKADKKAGRVATEGRIVTATSADGKRAAVVEVNSETDFVSGGDVFGDFAVAVVQTALQAWPDDLDGLLGASLDGSTVEETRRELIAKIGENINVRRFARLETAGVFGTYLHNNRIGVVVAVEGGDTDLAKDIAMHVAASNPVCVAESDVPADLLERERDILIGQAEQSGKPAEIIEKMVAGRVKKFLSEITLLGQPFVKDPDINVGKLLDNAGARVIRFVRFEVGEGIEKKDENFAEEVMAQVKGT